MVAPGLISTLGWPAPKSVAPNLLRLMMAGRMKPKRASTAMERPGFVIGILDDAFLVGVG